MDEAGRGHGRGVSREAIGTRIREIEAAMEAGKMSREEGARAIEATKRAMDEAGRGHGRDVSREAFGTRIREIEAAVEAGEMSREEGARAIEETKRAMEGASGGGRSDTRVDVDRKGEADRLYHLYAEIEGRIERAVESGELSREEAEKQLIEARREIFGRE